MSTHVPVQIRERGGRDTQLASAFGAGPWLLIAPHDDDFILGAGLLVLAAQAQGLPLHVAVATDDPGHAAPIGDEARRLLDECQTLVAALAALTDSRDGA